MDVGGREGRRVCDRQAPGGHRAGDLALDRSTPECSLTKTQGPSRDPAPVLGSRLASTADRARRRYRSAGNTQRIRREAESLPCRRIGHDHEPDIAAVVGHDLADLADRGAAAILDIE